MRIEQLRLLRYGKFTDQVLSFPRSDRDFHLIVGANEAGKSTTRSAILDLLYGIETRSTFDFLHTKTEMRLGARLEHGGTSLDFIRTKAKKSLFTASGSALADTALAAFLAGTDRGFFDDMFGLNHARLVAGGNDILSASSDLGAVLFESASGINRLGPVREQLAAEADKLWATRKSSDRTYYVAQDELVRASATLKETTVRTKDWLEARTRVEELEDRGAGLLARYRAFDAERIRLERVRRVASALRTLRERQAELGELAGVVLLPADAAKQLQDTLIALASAESNELLYSAQAKNLRSQLATLAPDDRLLRHEADIVALGGERQRLREHESDIDRRRLEIEGCWQRVQGHLRQLGWTAPSEEALAAMLPKLPARSALSSLVKGHGVLAQAAQASNADAAERATDLEALERQLAKATVTTVPTALRAALTEARGLGDAKSSARRADAALAKSRRELEASVSAIGRWPTDLVALRAVSLPSEARIHGRQKREADAETERKTLTKQHADLCASIKDTELAIAQYRNAHHPVSLTDLQSARAERNAVWNTIKAGQAPVAEAASDFEGKLHNADALSDARHDKASEAAELQSKIDSLQRLQEQASDTANRLAQAATEREAMDAEWSAESAALGVPGLPLRDFELARAARDKVLRASEAVAEAQDAATAIAESVAAAKSSLSAALSATSVAFAPADAFETLVQLATDTVETAMKAQTRFDELGKQRDDAVAKLARQRDKAAKAASEFAAWAISWGTATVNVGLSATSEVAAAETALAVLTRIDVEVATIHETRRTRIETMQRDLKDFADQVAKVSAATELAAMVPMAAVLELTARLGAAREEKKEAARIAKELQIHETKSAAAHASVEQAKAAVVPLLQLAKVCTHDDLHVVIARSDRKRRVESEAVAARKYVEENADGHALEALEAEVAAADVTQFPVLLADITRQIEEAREERDHLNASLTVAKTELAKIAGQDTAARAESERRDALAKMANAVERYIKVHTASRLLKWAIDRYRETKQGPMLARASEIFASLTLGSFAKLTVDFDNEPLTLHGQRADGKQVAIAHLSDGTRDQLYLALRLAALELHLGQGHALPFIADDLFINYDDPRAKAGLEALATLSEKTQVIFLSHHDHLVPSVKAVFGDRVNVVKL